MCSVRCKGVGLIGWWVDVSGCVISRSPTRHSAALMCSADVLSSQLMLMMTLMEGVAAIVNTTSLSLLLFFI